MRDRDKLGHLDLESLEIHIRSSMHHMGAMMLEKLLNSDSGDYRGRTLPCDKGDVFEFKEYRDKALLTVLGLVTVKRAYYYDHGCKRGWCPKDTALDIRGSSFSPGVRRMMGRVGAYRPFGLGHEDIKQMAGIGVDTKEIERVSHQLGQQVEGFYQREAGCRTVIGQRLKQSGMHWTVRGANNIIALRCCILSNRWEDFWEYRACA